MIKKLTKLRDAGYGEYPLIYGTADEGNEFHKVGNHPELVKVYDLNEYYLEVSFIEDQLESNAICIN